MRGRFELLLDELEALDLKIRLNNLQNEQWFLDIQDRLNEISVR